MVLDRWVEAVRSCRPGNVGVGAWSVHATEQRRLSLGTRDGSTGSAHTPLRLAESLGARYLLVWEDGTISRGSLERRQIADDPESALRQARAAAYDDPDAAQVAGPAKVPDVELVDAAVSNVIDGDLDVLGGRLEDVREILESGNFHTWSGSIGLAESRARLRTSKGVDVEAHATSASWYVGFNGEWGDGHAAGRMDSEVEYRQRLRRLAETVRLLARPAPAMPPGLHPVILHPHVVETLVLGTLLRNLEGSTVAHGESFFGRDDFGSDRPTLRADLSLTLDPTQPLKSGSYRFTTEGVPARRCELVSNGRLITPILGMKYASRLGMETTPVPYGMDTVELTAGETIGESEAFGLAAGGAVVLQVLGAHTQDAASGDFSLSAPQALIVGPDGPSGRIRTTISGNVFEVLRDEATRPVRFVGETTPGLLVHCRLDPR